MLNKTVQKLNELNRAFYTKQAISFHETRQVSWPGWGRVSDLIVTNGYIVNNPKILDIGCGNGRFLKELYSNRVIERGSYVGIDSSKELIEIAEENVKEVKNVFLQFYHLDLVSKPDIVRYLNTKFNLVVMFGLMHHIPDYQNRLNLINQAMRLLDKEGLLVISFWQFMKTSRLSQKRLPENKVKEVLGELHSDLEEGDYLLDWDNSALARYCHNFSDDELEKLQSDIVDLGYTIKDSYSADGKEGNLNRYLVITH